MDIPPTVKIFAGVTRRLFAFILDLLILNASFGLLFLIFKLINYIYIQYWLLFLFVFIFYFTLGDSMLFKGQTYGKKVCNIQSVDLSGNTISTVNSLIRSFYLALLYFSYHFIPYSIETLGNIIPEFVAFIIITSITIFMVFGITIFTTFHPYHQGLHDILAKSIIIVKDRYDEDKLSSSFNYSRLMASYFLTTLFTIICLILGIIIKIFFFK